MNSIEIKDSIMRVGEATLLFKAEKSHHNNGETIIMAGSKGLRVRVGY